MSTVAPAAGIDLVPFNGWRNNLRLRNGTAELIITLEVGPRILSYRKHGGINPFKIYEDQAGTTGETVWRNRGGHRLWVAPEDREITYCPDNAPVAWEQRGPLAVRVTPPAEAATGLQKQLDITLAPGGTGVTIVHRVTRTGATPVTLAPWSLTVMTPGGIAVLPEPPLGEHPRDLLPNRNLVLWPYTDLSDPRWHFGRRAILLRQDRKCGPIKIGVAHRPGWCGYLVEGVFFRKQYPWIGDAPYPDGGCNFEMFSNEKMLELESLGPLVQLKTGQSVEHIERWELHDGIRPPAAGSAEDLDKFVDSILAARAHCQD